MKNLLNKADSISRRNILKGIAATCFSMNIIDTLNAEQKQAVLAGGGKAKSVIFINVRGGMSHVDSFDIKETNKDAFKASAPIKTNADGIRIGKYFPKIAKHMDKFAVINSMSNNQGAHQEAQYLLLTGYEKRGTVIHPNFGAWVNKLSPTTSDIPNYIKTSTKNLGAGFFPSRTAALPVANPTQGLQYVQRYNEITSESFDSRYSLMQKINKEFAGRYSTRTSNAYDEVYADAVKLMNSKDLEVFDLKKEKQATLDAYAKVDYVNPKKDKKDKKEKKGGGNMSKIGSGLLLARRLVEKGVRYIEVDHDGWDHHYGIYEDFPEEAPDLDQAVSALMADLSSRGLLESTLVVFATEFGRSPQLNSRGGRNHHPGAYSCMLAGAGVKGGQKYGKTDDQGAKVIENKVKVRDFNATIAYAMGLPLKHTVMNKEGRPFTIADKGKPITAIF